MQSSSMNRARNKITVRKYHANTDTSTVSDTVFGGNLFEGRALR